MKYKSFFKAVLKILRNNLSLKIAAIFLALILWSYVIAETNPPRPLTLDNIPVKLENIEELKVSGLTISEDITSVIKNVKVNLEVRQKELKLVNAENVTARIDFSKTNEKGEIQYKIIATTKYGTVLNVQPSVVTLTVDDYIKKTIPVKCEVKDGLQSYYIGQPALSPDVIDIMGARKDVVKASSALCRVDLSKETSSINQSVDLTILDNDGNPLDNSVYFERLPSVIVKIDILPKKEVVINGLGSIVNAGKIKEGYEIGGISVEPQKIEIAGEKALLDAISEVYLEDMDVSGASEDMTFNVLPKSIEGVRFLNVNEIAAIVHISQKQTQKVFKGVPIAVQNLPSGLSASLNPKTVDITVSGGVEDIKNLQKSDIKLFIDLAGYSKGSYTLSVQAESIETVLPENISYSLSEIKVSIK